MANSGAVVPRTADTSTAGRVLRVLHVLVVLVVLVVINTAAKTPRQRTPLRQHCSHHHELLRPSSASFFAIAANPSASAAI